MSKNLLHSKQISADLDAVDYVMNHQGIPKTKADWDYERKWNLKAQLHKLSERMKENREQMRQLRKQIKIDTQY